MEPCWRLRIRYFCVYCGSVVNITTLLKIRRQFAVSYSVRRIKLKKFYSYGETLLRSFAGPLSEPPRTPEKCYFHEIYILGNGDLFVRFLSAFLPVFGLGVDVKLWKNVGRVRRLCGFEVD